MAGRKTGSKKPRPSTKEKRQWARLEAIIDHAFRRGALGEAWDAAADVIEEKLWPAGGYASAADFFERHMSTDRIVGARRVRLVKYASLEDEQTFGAGVLDALVDYIETKHGRIKGRLPIALDKIRIPVVRFGEEELVTISDATIADLEAATKALTPKT
jgi:hypothetical protein